MSHLLLVFHYPSFLKEPWISQIWHFLRDGGSNTADLIDHCFCPFQPNCDTMVPHGAMPTHSFRGRSCCVPFDCPWALHEGFINGQRLTQRSATWSNLKGPVNMVQVLQLHVYSKISFLLHQNHIHYTTQVQTIPLNQPHATIVMIGFSVDIDAQTNTPCCYNWMMLTLRLRNRKLLHKPSYNLIKVRKVGTIYHFTGHVKGLALQVLVNGGSTDNFSQPWLAKKFKLIVLHGWPPWDQMLIMMQTIEPSMP